MYVTNRVKGKGVYLQNTLLNCRWFQHNPMQSILLQQATQRLLWGQFKQQAHGRLHPHTTKLGDVLVIERGKKGDLLPDLPVGMTQMFWMVGQLHQLLYSLVF